MPITEFAACAKKGAKNKTKKKTKFLMTILRRDRPHNHLKYHRGPIPAKDAKSSREADIAEFVPGPPLLNNYSAKKNLLASKEHILGSIGDLSLVLHLVYGVYLA